MELAATDGYDPLSHTITMRRQGQTAEEDRIDRHVCDQTDRIGPHKVVQDVHVLDNEHAAFPFLCVPIGHVTIRRWSNAIRFGARARTKSPGISPTQWKGPASCGHR